MKILNNIVQVWSLSVCLLTIIAGCLFSGCATIDNVIDNNEAVAATVIRYATVKAIEGIKRLSAEDVIGFCDSAERILSDNKLSLSDAIPLIDLQIRWERFDAADAILLRGLLDSVEAEIAKRVNKGILDGKSLTTISKIVGYVREGAIIARDGQHSSTMGVAPID